MNKSGSALIISIIFIVFFTIASFSIWYNTSLYSDIIFLQEQYYKKYYLAYCLLNYSCRFAQNNFDNICEQIDKTGAFVELNLDNFINLINKNIDKNFEYKYCATCYFNKLKDKNNNILVITLILFDQITKNQIFALNCEFELFKQKLKNNKLIKNFTIKKFKIL